MLQYYKCNIIQALPKFSYQNIFPYLEGFFTSTTYVVLNIVNSTFVTFLLIEKFLHVSRCWVVRALVLWVTKSLKFPHYHSEYCHTLILLRIVQQQSASGISSYLTFRCYHFEKLWVHEKSNDDITAVPSVQMSIIKRIKCSANNSRLQWMSSSCTFPSLSPLVLPEDYQCTYGTTLRRIRLPSKRYGLGKEHPSQPPSQASPSEA